MGDGSKKSEVEEYEPPTIGGLYLLEPTYLIVVDVIDYSPYWWLLTWIEDGFIKEQKWSKQGWRDYVERVK